MEIVQLNRRRLRWLFICLLAGIPTLVSAQVQVPVDSLKADSIGRLQKPSSQPAAENIHRQYDFGDLLRNILHDRTIKVYTHDQSLDLLMEELSRLRAEIRAIGVNINQITRSFNQDKAETQRAFYVLKVADQYKKVDERVEQLLTIISRLAERWLQK